MIILNYRQTQMPLQRSISHRDDATKVSQVRKAIVLHPEHMDDVLLWKALRSGDEKALVTLFDRFTPAMFNYGYKIAGDRELVKDAIQELLIEIWRNRERLGDTDSIKYYLFKALRRKLVRMQSRIEHRLYTTLSEGHIQESSPSPEFAMISEQVSSARRKHLEALLATLSPRQQEAMFLRYFEELSCDQIAVVMHLTRQRVYNLLHEAIEKLRSGTEAKELRG